MSERPEPDDGGIFSLKPERPMEKGWETYSKKAFGGAADHVTLALCQKSFYAGAVSVMNILQSAQSDNEMVRSLRAIHTETMEIFQALALQRQLESQRKNDNNKPS